MLCFAKLLAGICTRCSIVCTRELNSQRKKASPLFSKFVREPCEVKKPHESFAVGSFVYVLQSLCAECSVRSHETREKHGNIRLCCVSSEISQKTFLRSTLYSVQKFRSAMVDVLGQIARVLCVKEFIFTYIE